MTMTESDDNHLNTTYQSLLVHHEIESTGEYVFFMAICDEHSAPVRINGHIESLDPCTYYSRRCTSDPNYNTDGYLPAGIFPDLPFYGALSLIYTILGFGWLILCFLYRFVSLNMNCYNAN